MLCTEIVSDIQNSFCTQQVPHVLQKKRASDKNLPVFHETIAKRQIKNKPSEKFIPSSKRIHQSCRVRPIIALAT